MKRISDKRKAKGERLCWNSTIKAKAYTLKRTPLRKVSQKAKSLWTACRKAVLEKWGNKCFLCGRTGELHIHHFRYTRTQEPSKKYDLDNLCPLCPACHNHNGADARFYELKHLILKKLGEE